jgi:hypothetical protein
MASSETVCAECGLDTADPAAALTIPDEFGRQDAALESRALELPDDGGEANSSPSPLPAVIASQPAAQTWNRRELLAIPIALLGGAVITFGLLSTRGAASPESPAAPPASTASAPAAPAPSPATIGAKWSTSNVSRWIGNGRRSFAAELLAENRVAIWQRDVRPVLVVRCMSRRPEVFVFTDSAAKIEPRTEDHTVTLAFDDGEERQERWPDSADHDALFAPDGSALAQDLAAARTMRFGFTPHNASPVVATFNVAGFADLFRSSSKDCSWKR